MIGIKNTCNPIIIGFSVNNILLKCNDWHFVTSGYMGGGLYNQGGSAANPVCLPRDPKYDKYDDTVNNLAFMYGAEYELDAHMSTVLFEQNVHDHDVPCAVCRSTTRATTLLIPGRKNCYPGWRMEYTGYLMSGTYTQPASTEYVCVDGSPEMVPHGYANKDGYLLYSVEGSCGSLPCPQYVNGREIACVVCSK